jgi:hypothetical protein
MKKGGKKMNRILISLMTTILVFGLAISSHAILIDRGGGMIYSTDMNVTWLQDAKYARTSGYDADGLMNWYDAMQWAQNLSYGGYDDWRLPTYLNEYEYQRENATLEHEMAYLVFIELGSDGASPHDFGPFINVMDGDSWYIYWSSTEFPPNDAGEYHLDCG